MEKSQTVIIGAGPAGLAAAIEIAKAGGQVTLLDENWQAGGQLFKQIHKFFGSYEHLAGTRGFQIGNMLLKQTNELGVKVLLNSPVLAIYPNKIISYLSCGRERKLIAEKIIIATGATENTLAFPGSTLPGVMGAGAVQTMVNVHRVLPGKEVLMVGAGNVGLIVTYQLLQAGANVKAIIESAPRIGGYGVHAAKVRRAGVPIHVSHTINQVLGKNQVVAAELVKLSPNKEPLSGSERIIDVDTICLAVGLSPLIELAQLAKCEFTFLPALGGYIPKHDNNMQTTISGIYVAGDISGIEEASSALEEGRLAGVACAQALGLLNFTQAEGQKEIIRKRLEALRTGPFGEIRRQEKEKLFAISKEGERRD